MCTFLSDIEYDDDDDADDVKCCSQVLGFISDMLLSVTGDTIKPGRVNVVLSKKYIFLFRFNFLEAN